MGAGEAGGMQGGIGGGGGKVVAVVVGSWLPEGVEGKHGGNATTGAGQGGEDGSFYFLFVCGLRLDCPWPQPEPWPLPPFSFSVQPPRSLPLLVTRLQQSAEE